MWRHIAAVPMRIRQVRPEFFTDAIVSKLTPGIRLTYIGLWCVADDAGWMAWDVSAIGASLSPYESRLAREKRVTLAGVALGNANRLKFYECGCAWIPKLEEHQRIGGNKSFIARDRHTVHTSTDSQKARLAAKEAISALQDAGLQKVHTNMDVSAGKLGNGRLSNGTLVAPASADALARLRDEEDAADIAAVTARRLQVAR
jgi:hypothetical protein